MMTSTPQSFRISFEWKPREKKYDQPERPSSWPVVYLGLLSFLDDFEGTFCLHFDDTEVVFELEADLLRVFEALPKELVGVLRKDDLPHALDFTDQATAVLVTLVPHDQQLTIEFKPFVEPPEYYYQFFGRQFHVSTAQFISEWVRFASAVLDAVLEHDPSVTEDPEVKRYSERLEALRSAVKTGKVDPGALPQRAE
jgi:hypothetical protein